MSNTLIAKVDKSTEREFAQNAIQGHLALELNKSYKDDDFITIKFGQMTFGKTVRQFREWGSGSGIISTGESIPIRLDIIGNKLLLNFVVFDIYGRWIAEIENNYWRRNPTTIGKFNYDKKGFEVIDNLEIQGMLLLHEEGKILFGGSKGGRMFMTIKDGNYIQEAIGIYNSIGVRQLFEYTGEQWIGVRKKYD